MCWPITNERYRTSNCFSQSVRLSVSHTLVIVLVGCPWSHVIFPNVYACSQWRENVPRIIDRTVWHRGTLSTSGFVDDFVFSYNGPYGAMTLAQQYRCNVVHGLKYLLRGIGYFVYPRRLWAPRLDEPFVQGCWAE